MEGQVLATQWPPLFGRQDISTRFSRLADPRGICEKSGVPFWMPWDGERDDLNACFEDVTLPLCTLILLLAVTPWITRSASVARPFLRAQPPNRLDVVRQSLILFCVLLPLAFLIGSVSVQSLSLSREQQLYLIISFLFFFVFFFLQQRSCRNGRKQHPCLCLALIVHLVSQVVKLQSALRQWHERHGGALEALLPSDVEIAILLVPEVALCVALCLFSSPTVRHHVHVSIWGMGGEGCVSMASPPSAGC